MKKTKKIKCKDCLLFNEKNNYCGHWNNYEQTKESKVCKYVITQQDYDFMIKEQDFELDYFIENY